MTSRLWVTLALASGLLMWELGGGGGVKSLGNRTFRFRPAFWLLYRRVLLIGACVLHIMIPTSFSAAFLLGFLDWRLACWFPQNLVEKLVATRSQQWFPTVLTVGPTVRNRWDHRWDLVATRFSTKFC